MEQRTVFLFRFLKIKIKISNDHRKAVTVRPSSPYQRCGENGMLEKWMFLSSSHLLRRTSNIWIDWKNYSSTIIFKGQVQANTSSKQTKGTNNLLEAWISSDEDDWNTTKIDNVIEDNIRRGSVVFQSLSLYYTSITPTDKPVCKGQTAKSLSTEVTCLWRFRQPAVSPQRDGAHKFSYLSKYPCPIPRTIWKQGNVIAFVCVDFHCSFE